jgi:excisionase family DNA binding protein
VSDPRLRVGLPSVVAGLLGVVAGLPTEPHALTEGLQSSRRPSVAASAGSGDPRRTGMSSGSGSTLNRQRTSSESLSPSILGRPRLRVLGRAVARIATPRRRAISSRRRSVARYDFLSGQSVGSESITTSRRFSLRIQPDDEPEETIAIPLPAFRLLADILTEMAKGNAVTLIAIHAELTTQQAADLINVSRPFLIEQLKEGSIPFRKVGKHRRILFQDLMAYEQKMDQNRLKTLDELSAQAQELGMGY